MNFLMPYLTAIKAGLIILLLSIVGIHLWHDSHVASERDTAISDLQSYKDSQSALVEANKKEIAIIQNAAKIQHENAYQQHQKELIRLNLNGTQIKKDLQNEKNNITNMLNDAYQLRLQQASSDSSRMSEIPTATELSTEGSSNATITLIKAGQSCALDYQELMQAWLDNCKLYGCK